MVTVIDCNIEEFKQRVKEKELFCFGSGKYFRDFLSKNLQITVSGVIDNYHQGKKFITVNDQEYRIYSVKDFCDIYNENCVLVITLKAFEEVIDQLDAIKELDMMPCFISMALDNYLSIRDDQRIIFKSQIKKLSKRMSVESQRSMMQKFEMKIQIWEYYQKSNTGGSKARTDICKVLSDCGYVVKKIHCSGREENSLLREQVQYEWKRVFDNLEDGGILFMQHPAPVETILPEKLFHQMKIKKHIRFIVLVHEVESLRKKYDSEYKQKEFEVMISVGDIFIVHNDVMRKFYIDQGIKEEQVISLGIFDYLDSKTIVEKTFEKSITIAANLDLGKSSYLLQLKELKDLRIHLYGPNYTESISKGAVNIEYHGAFSTEIISLKLDRGFGLVWDGDSIETCSGGTGEYLKYNNPHKLSLYLSAGLPVIIWNQAALAQFVKENKIGFCVDSLYEIQNILDKITKQQYDFYVRNAKNLSNRLKKGIYIREALKKAEEVLKQF